MKLRLQSNSIRLRLKQSEVARLEKKGRLEESIVMGMSDEQTFYYILESSSTVTLPRANLDKNRIVVLLPAEAVSRWATSDEVGIEAMMRVDEQKQLQILVEKDFACLNGPDEQNIDTFPNPLAGTKC